MGHFFSQRVEVAVRGGVGLRVLDSLLDLGRADMDGVDLADEAHGEECGRVEKGCAHLFVDFVD